MKKFQYRLQSILKIKEHIEKERQKEFAATVQQVQNQMQTLEQIKQEKSSTCDQQRKSMRKTISLAEMLVYTRYLVKLKRNRITGNEMLKALNETAEEKRALLVVAAKERKIYEKLKEKRKEDFDKEAEAVARKESDEMAANAFRQKIQE
jgi:flagellar FliJ protein